MDQNLIIQKGGTFSLVLRWEVEPLVHKPVSAVTRATPCVITATAHGVPDGWNVALVDATGMTELNAESMPPAGRDWHKATLVDADNVKLNDVSSAKYKVYVSGGALVYYTPQDLTGFLARLTVKDKVGGTVLMSLTDSDGIDLDAVNFAITLTIDAADTALIDWKKGVYDLELESATGVVTKLLEGRVSVQEEVTTA